LNIFASCAFAWHEEGHHSIARAAVAALPDDLPAFFRDGVETIAHCTADADVFRDRKTPELRHAEGPEHYLDLELLGDHEPQRQRYAFVAWCDKQDLPVSKVGLLPHAINEWTQRLTLAFAEHRKDPDNPHVKLKCLVYAGMLAHYAGDLANPLHCTIHFDGRVGADGKSPHTGIHQKVDSLLEYRYFDHGQLVSKAELDTFDDVFAAVMKHIRASNKLVANVYALEAKLPEERSEKTLDEDVRAFAQSRGRAASHLVGSLFLTAWKRSADVELPEWVKRDEWENPPQPTTQPSR